MVGVFWRLMMARVPRAADAEVSPGIKAAGGFEDVDAEHEIGFAVRNDGRAVVVAGLEEGDVGVDAAVADGEAVLVAEENVEAFAVAGADERGGRDADAHAADAGEVDAPGMVELTADGKRELDLVEIGQARLGFLGADDRRFPQRRGRRRAWCRRCR